MFDRLRTPFLWSLVALSAACCPQASVRSSVPARHASLAAETRAGSHQARPIMVGRTYVPNGRAIASLSESECRKILRSASVRFDPVPKREAGGISQPIELRSTVLGVRFEPANGMAKNGIVDCRLAASLLAWAPILRDAGVTRVEHYSTYRAGARVAGTSKVSGHAHALAIDAARFRLANGEVVEVLSDWDDRERGGSPCPVRRDESESGKLLRTVVCRAVERDLFQVVLTPHHDRAHQNHVHLEVVPRADWSFIR